MEIKGNQVSLTSSEADVLQDMGLCGPPSQTKMAISQKVLDARVALARQYMPEDELPAHPITACKWSIEARLTLEEKMRGIHQLEKMIGADSHDAEHHIIDLTLSTVEKQNIRHNVQITHDGAKDFTTHFAQATEQSAQVVDHLKNFVINDGIADLMEPDQVDALANLLDDHEMQAAYNEYEFNAKLQQLNVTAGILRALDADATRQ
jgi:hypothetical protein